MAATTLLNHSTYNPYNTGNYKRTLNFYKAAPNGSQDWAYLAPQSTASTDSGNVNAIAFNNGVSYGADPNAANPISLVSDNQTSGITFLVFNKNPLFKDITLLAGPNSTDNGSSYPDGADSIFYSTNSTNQPISVIHNTIVTGDATTDPLTDNDFLVFGSDSFEDAPKTPYSANLKYSGGKSAYSLGIPYLSAGLDKLQLTVKGNTVSTGNGSDTLLFASVVSTTQIGGTGAGEGNVFDMGEGADLIYFSTPSQISAQNTINIGKANGTADGQADTLLFNFNSAQQAGSGLTGLNGTSTYMTIKGFKDGQDYLYYNGQFYTSAANVSTATANRIRFS